MLYITLHNINSSPASVMLMFIKNMKIEMELSIKVLQSGAYPTYESDKIIYIDTLIT
jgi:hypothetical protein